MDSVLVTTVDETAYLIKQMYDLCGRIEMLDTLYEGSPAYKTRITQDGLDSVPSYAQAGLTKAQLDAVVYILKTARAAIINTDIAAVAVMTKL